MAPTVAGTSEYIMSLFSESIREHCGSDLSWDHALNFNSSALQFSPCFLHTFLVWIPCAFVWFWTPLQVYYCLSADNLQLPWRPLNVTKLVLSLLLSLNTLVLFVHTVAEHRNSVEGNIPMVRIIYPVLLSVTLFNSAMLIFLCRKRGIHTSGVLTLAWLFFGIFGAPELYHWIRGSNHELEFVLYMIYYPLIWVQFVLHCFADSRRRNDQMGKRKGEEKICPENESSFFNQLLFWWFTELAILGWKRPLEIKDLWSLNDEDKSSTLVPKFEAQYNPKMMKYWKEKAVAEHVNQKIIKCRTVSEEVKIVSSAYKNGTTVTSDESGRSSWLRRVVHSQSFFAKGFIYKSRDLSN